jgi:protein-tyrosine kinase
MRNFLLTLSQWYRRGLVIIDVAPVLGVPNASVLASNVGQIVLVVEADRTGRAAVAESIALLKGCQKISLLLNKVDAALLVDNYGSYYGQQYKVPNIGGTSSIPERITNYVGNYLRRWYHPPK